MKLLPHQALRSLLAKRISPIFKVVAPADKVSGWTQPIDRAVYRTCLPIHSMNHNVSPYFTAYWVSAGERVHDAGPRRNPNSNTATAKQHPSRRFSIFVYDQNLFTRCAAQLYQRPRAPAPFLNFPVFSQYGEDAVSALQLEQIGFPCHSPLFMHYTYTSRWAPYETQSLNNGSARGRRVDRRPTKATS